MQDLKLTDLISVHVLQEIQDAFSEYTGMAALTADEYGVPITKGSGFTEFCTEVIRSNPKGRSRCENCDRMGATMNQGTGKPSIYTCHAGLVDYAAPIMVNGMVYGNFIGGQVRATERDVEAEKKIAQALGIDYEEFAQKAELIHRIPMEQIEKAAYFLTEIAGILSGMALENYKKLDESVKLERIARAQTGFMVEIYDKMRDSLKTWTENANTAARNGDMQEMTETLRNFSQEGMMLVSMIGNNVEYIKMLEGGASMEENELQEVEYEIRRVVHFIQLTLDKQFQKKKNTLEVEIDEDVPEKLLGDEGRISQVIMNLLSGANQYNENGTIRLHISGENRFFATNLRISVSDNGEAISEDRTRRIRECLRFHDQKLMEELYADNNQLPLVIILVEQLAGFMDFVSEEGKGTVFTAEIPQLSIYEPEL